VSELLRVAVVVEGDVLTARLEGSAEAEAVAVLERTLADIDGRTGLSKVTLDIRGLEFATSSALKVLANWLLDLAERESKLRVEILSSATHSWQRRSLQAITAIVPGFVDVRTDE